MDPLSVSASVVGLLTAGVQITKAVTKTVKGVLNAPELANQILQEIHDITAALGFIQTYLHERAHATTKRKNLILLEHILITLTGCVTTYSDLQTKVDDLETSPGMGFLAKVQWWREESGIGALVGRLQNHKSSLTLMLTILQCQTMQEAENSNRRLYVLVEQILQSSPDLAARINGLEREGSIIAESEAQSVIARDSQCEGVSGVSSVAQNTGLSLPSPFDEILQASKVYSKTNKRDSMASTSSTALYTTALSIFSKLSLSQVSNISFYALPIYLDDLSNSHCYVFGEEGALQSDRTAQPPTTPVPEPRRSSEQPTSSRRRYGPRLLGRYARRRPIISAPENPLHVTHTGYNSATQEYSGLPREWKRIIEASAVSVKDDPQKQQAFETSDQPGSLSQTVENAATRHANDHIARSTSPGLVSEEGWI